MSRSRLAATAAAIALALPLAALTGAAPAVAHRADPPPDQQFVTRTGAQLTLAGRPYRFAGTNNYYLEYSAPAMTDAVLAKASASGSTVVRAWAFLDVPSATTRATRGCTSSTGTARARRTTTGRTGSRCSTTWSRRPRSKVCV